MAANRSHFATFAGAASSEQCRSSWRKMRQVPWCTMGIWANVRVGGSALGVLTLFGAAALAPFSVTPAFAGGHWISSGAVLQGLTSVDAEGNIIDLTVSAENTGAVAKEAQYTLAAFMSAGVVNWGGYKFTYYSQQVLPGPGLAIPGRHVNEDGYVSDEDGYIVLAGSAPKGTVYDTPFGYQGKIYDRGTAGNHLDVYIR